MGNAKYYGTLRFAFVTCSFTSSVNVNYDKIAMIYDRTSRLIYGNTLVEMQVHLLHAVPPGSHILIAGGGTGWILDELTRIHPSGLTIDYAEASARMMAISAKRNTGENKVRFICEKVQDMDAQTPYDVVFSAFLFDNFSEVTAQQIFAGIDKRLKPGALWLYADFCNSPKLGHRLLLRVMYLFFRVTVGIETMHLPDMSSVFARHAYRELSRQNRMKGFITSVIYKKAV